MYQLFVSLLPLPQRVIFIKKMGKLQIIKEASITRIVQKESHIFLSLHKKKKPDKNQEKKIISFLLREKRSTVLIPVTAAMHAEFVVVTVDDGSKAVVVVSVVALLLPPPLGPCRLALVVSDRS